MLIRRAVLLDGTRTDIRVGPRIVEMAPELAPQRGEDSYDAAGGTVLPGLHDHHLHVRAAAAAMTSAHVGPDAVGSRQDLAAVLADARIDRDGWIRAVGYHEAAAGPLDRRVLDEVCPQSPVRVQHRSGVQWTLNSAALARVGLGDHPDGRLRSADSSWPATLTRAEPDLTPLSGRLCRLGVTGITDATPDLDAADIEALLDAHRRAELLQAVHVLAPGKRILHDDALDLDELTRWIADLHARGIPVAVHCVTAAQLVVTLEALRCAGHHPGDRIEHAAVVPDGSLAALADADVTVVTQPNFVAERGDQYIVDVPAAEHHELWRLASLRNAGVAVALSTDAPFGDADPWAAMQAAVHRCTGAGVVLGVDERIPPAEALTRFLGEPLRPGVVRAVKPGAAGDLCLLAAPPAEVLHELDGDLVSATVIGGEIAYRRS